MKITEDMNLVGLAGLMGHNYDFPLAEVLRMRSILCDSIYFEADTDDIHEVLWQGFLDDAVAPMGQEE